jgi:hypothetical protein
MMATNFVPTYLYVKQHNITGLKYFGKTTLTYEKMLEYKGSGNRWLAHLDKHGADITTVWFKLFVNENECTNFALNFSTEQNIVESTDWANLIPENGLAGFPAGLTFTDSHKKNLSETKLGKTWEEIYGTEGAKLKREQNSAPKGPMSDERKKNISEAKKGMNPPHNWSNKSRDKVSKKLSGIKRSVETIQKMQKSAKIKKTCPHCGITGSGPSMQRWHFKNCKHDNN